MPLPAMDQKSTNVPRLIKRGSAGPLKKAVDGYSFLQVAPNTVPHYDAGVVRKRTYGRFKNKTLDYNSCIGGKYRSLPFIENSATFTPGAIQFSTLIKPINFPVHPCQAMPPNFNSPHHQTFLSEIPVIEPNCRKPARPFSNLFTDQNIAIVIQSIYG